MLRQDFLNTLKIVYPALGGPKSILPILSNFCFDGKYVLACDDAVAMRTRCELELQGGLPGQLLVSMLSASSAEEVDFSYDEDQSVSLLLGRTKLKMPKMDVSDVYKRLPKSRDIAEGQPVPITEDIVKALRLAARVGSTDVQTISRSGVTVRFDNKKTYFYSTNGMALAVATAKNSTPDLAGTSVILPKRFCDLLLTLAAKSLTITSDGGLVAATKLVQLFGAQPATADYKQFDSILDQSISEGDSAVALPRQLTTCLQRSTILTPDLVRLAYSQGRLSIVSTGGGSEITDSLKIDLGGKPFSVLTDAASVLKYLDVATRIDITPDRIVLLGEGLVVLIAVQGDN